MSGDEVSAVSGEVAEKLNYVSIKLTAMFHEVDLAVGTCFLFESSGRLYIITNWHNVTGRHPKTNLPLHSMGGVPDRLSLQVPYHGVANGLPAILWVPVCVPLFQDDEMLEPFWQEHPLYYGERVDVVAIPIARTRENCALIAANNPTLELDSIRLRPSLDAFILGYPRGLTGGGNWPIWKRGSIASDPEVGIGLLPQILIDSATREGMSGAPVYAQESGFWLPEGTGDIRKVRFGVGRRFLGIYSGRVGDDSFSAQLGIVWTQAAIEKAIANDLPFGVGSYLEGL